MAEKNKDDMHIRISGLKNACDELENEVTRQESEVDEMIEVDHTAREKEQKLHQESIVNLKALNQDLKRELEELLNSTKA